MIWIGTSGWMYPHWMGRFYPPGLPASDQLAYYAREFPTVEINRSFYRHPTRAQFAAWATQVAHHPGFRFAVKASRYLTHLKKLLDREEGVVRFFDDAAGLGAAFGPALFQLPPHWRANPERLRLFLAALPNDHRIAFEFRDATWFEPAVVRLLAAAGCALVRAVGGPHYTPMEVPEAGPFRYLRFHGGLYGTGYTDGELAFWTERIAADAAAGLDVFIYFNNDPEGHAIYDARRLRALLEPSGAVAA